MFLFKFLDVTGFAFISVVVLSLYFYYAQCFIFLSWSITLFIWYFLNVFYTILLLLLIKMSFSWAVCSIVFSLKNCAQNTNSFNTHESLLISHDVIKIALSHLLIDLLSQMFLSTIVTESHIIVQSRMSWIFVIFTKLIVFVWKDILYFISCAIPEYTLLVPNEWYQKNFHLT